MSDAPQTDPKLPEALERLRQGGYAIGTSSVSAQGHTMVTVSGQMMSQEDIVKLAGMDEPATVVRSEDPSAEKLIKPPQFSLRYHVHRVMLFSVGQADEGDTAQSHDYLEPGRVVWLEAPPKPDQVTTQAYLEGVGLIVGDARMLSPHAQ